MSTEFEIEQKIIPKKVNNSHGQTASNLPTMSHVRDISRSSSSLFEFSVLKTPMRLPSSLNLRVIARVSTSSVAW